MNDRAKLAMVAMALMMTTGFSWLMVIPYYFEADVINRAPGPLIGGTAFALGMTAVAALYIAREYGAVRSGLPLLDERSKVNSLKAGYWSFFGTMILVFVLILYALSLPTNSWDLGSNYVDESIFGILVAMPAMFIGFWLYFTFFGGRE
ncbi:MAG: hypothetical protein MUC90_02515 [Thermoplasmata archaeon]|jgi:hypothetical protein|nr:hypothetical protein [Thermoplasmata archaeon]